MGNKICSNCNKEKPLSDFSKKNKTSTGEQKYQPKCKDCVNEEMISYREKHIQDRIEYDKEYYAKNKENILNNKKVYHQKNKEDILIKKKKYRDNPESKLIQKEYRKNNRKHLNELQSKYRKENPHIIAWRSILHRVIKKFNTKKEQHTIDILGYSANELKSHMESLFIDDMTWDNHGEWEIDHIIPVSSFPNNTPPYVVNALSNLQPLWKDKNREKFNKIF
jgi:hypothetical protein